MSYGLRQQHQSLRVEQNFAGYIDDVKVKGDLLQLKCLHDPLDLKLSQRREDHDPTWVTLTSSSFTRSFALRDSTVSTFDMLCYG
jgi:hypothetical protein